MKRKQIEQMIAQLGLPATDLYVRPTSNKRFPDGANYRVEISGMETSKILQATIEEAKTQKVPFHRAISLVRGEDLYVNDQLKEFAQIAAGEGVEVIVTPGPRPTRDIGRQIATPEGVISGFGMRGMESITHYFEEIFRCIDLGFRGFLVWDSGVLDIITDMKKNGHIPADITFKWSIFGGCTNPAMALNLEQSGVDTINPTADLDIAMLAAIRSAISVPMDVHIQLWQSMGGYNRMHEALDIARVASPVYFKMESGPAFAMYAQWSSEAMLIEMGREKIRSIRRIIDIINENNPEIKVSDWTPKDLRIPQPRG